MNNEYVPKEGEIVLASNIDSDNPRDWVLMFFVEHQHKGGGIKSGYVCCPQASWETYGDHLLFDFVKPVSNQAVLDYIDNLEHKIEHLQQSMKKSLKVLQKAANV